MLPNFLYIGPDKTGSSWIHSILMQHPESFVPKCKDIYYFDKQYHRGISWYSGFFKGIDGNVKAIGELSHDYMFSRDAALRIKNDIPDVKLITCLRHPVERTFSHYLYLARSGVTRESFRDALISQPELIGNSMYSQHLQVYFDIFDKGNVKIFFFGDLKKDPTKFAMKLYNFLGISFYEQINYKKKVRIASKSKYYFLSKLVKFLANLSRKVGLVNLVGLIKHSPIVSFLYVEYKDDKPKISDDDREFLLGIFREDVHCLEKLLNVELSAWLK
ncbi:MAG: sulfotransferase [Pseudomonadota bacterium]